MYLTSVSIEGGTLGYGKDKIYRSDFVDRVEIENVVYGDMGGIPLPRPNLTAKQREVLASIEESWTGVTRNHLQECVNKDFRGHPTTRPPGCILTAVGEAKARNVYQAVVKEGLVNHLFMDYECAQALDALLKQPPQNGE